MDNVMEEQLMKSRQDAAVTDEMENLRKKYKEKDGRIYEIRTTIQEDDEEEKEFTFLFRKPGTASYERYVKLSSNSAVKALKTFVMDNICEEQYKKTWRCAGRISGNVHQPWREASQHARVI